jgi:hypothetical protein
MTIKRRTPYEVLLRPSATVGLGRGDAASLSVVWMPGKSRQKAPPLKVRLVLYDLSGKQLAEKEAAIAPFSGVSVDYEQPSGQKRQQVFGYVFIDGLTAKLAEELFGGIEVYDLTSGRTSIAGITPALG